MITLTKYLTIRILGGSILGVKFLDPLAGVVVSGMILKAGLETGYQRFILNPNLIYHLFALAMHLLLSSML